MTSSSRAGLQVAQRRLADDECDAVAAELLLAEAEAAQPLGARALEELQVVGVEDDPRGVGVFPVDANRDAERRLARGAIIAVAPATARAQGCSFL
jgi:hypothetical protein